MYIQDKVEEYADEIFERLQNGAVMYFCGLKGMMPGTISASRCVEVPSRHRRDSCPSSDEVDGFFSISRPFGPRRATAMLRAGIQDMLKEVCRKKGLTYDDFVADLKKKGQWRVEVY